MRQSLLLASAALISLAACTNKAEEAPKAEATASAGWDAGGDGKQVVIEADAESGKLAMQLPGGVEGNLRLPPAMAARMAGDGNFDLEGVGTYPGATIKGMRVQANTDGGAEQALVDLSFAAPDAPATVADWYEQAFKARGRTVTRSGDTISGTTGDGNPFTLAITPAPNGSIGQMRIVDVKKG